jgi:hypothetical protein
MPPASVTQYAGVQIACAAGARLSRVVQKLDVGSVKIIRATELLQWPE